MENYQERQTSYEGFERLKSSVKFNLSMHYKIFMFLLVLHCIAFLISLYMTRQYHTYVTAKFCIASVVNFFYPPLSIPFINPDGGKVISDAGILANDAWIQEVAFRELKRLRNLVFYAALIYLLYPIILKLLRLKSEKASAKRYIRGSKIISVAEYERSAAHEALDLPFGSVKMPVNAEQKHCFIVGRPGVGKTVALSQVIERLRKRNEKAIIYDQKGDFLTKFYDPQKDLIFNPLDVRCLGWNLFNEIKTKMDINAMVSSLIPDDKTDNPFWREAPRGLLDGILRYLIQTGQTTNKDLWRVLTMGAKEMGACLKDIPGAEVAYQYIENPKSKTTDSILSILMQYTRCIEYMCECDGSFNVREWMNSKKAGTIYITNYTDIKDTLKPILSLFIDILGRRLLSMPDSHNRRVFFFLDEFGTLQRLTTILQLLTLSRSKGGSVFVGIQDYGQIDKIYGKEHRDSIVNACGNSVTFSVKAGSADEASRALGDIEYMKTDESVSMGGKSKGKSLTQRKQKEPIILPSELDSLPDLTAVVKFNNYHHVMSQWKYKYYMDLHPSFIMRKGLEMTTIKNRPLPKKKEPTTPKDMTNSKGDIPPDKKITKENEPSPTEKTPVASKDNESLPKKEEPAAAKNETNKENNVVSSKETIKKDGPKDNFSVDLNIQR